MALPSKSQLNWTIHGINLIERAKALLEHNNPNPTPEEIIITKWCEEAEEWLAS